MKKCRIVAPCVVAGMLGAVALPLGQALAWDHHGHQGRREVIVVGHDRYHYRDGRFYRPGWFGMEVALTIPPFGAVVTAIPTGYTTVVTGGETYFCYNHIYYRRHANGYIVVPEPVIAPVVVQPAPVVVAPAAPAAPVVPAPVIPAAPANGNTDVVVINVPNTDGTYTPVRLIKRYKGYEGPQGEFYAEHPTVEQLRVLYGK